ncbi:MAG: hypothetical protein AB7D51_07465 [Desulfovibrionaceae bacterium]
MQPRPFTGRFTAKGPLGYAAGDDDLYGYCLDDPVNAVDPTGMFFFLPFLAGLGGATALAGVGAIGAGLAADGLNYFFGDKEKEAGKDGLRSTKGAAKGVGMATAVNAGIAATAAVPEATASVMPYAATAARSVGAAGGALLDKAKKGYDVAQTMVINQSDKLGPAGEFVSGVVDPGPPNSSAEVAGSSVKLGYDLASDGADWLRKRRR